MSFMVLTLHPYQNVLSKYKAVDRSGISHGLSTDCVENEKLFMHDVQHRTVVTHRR